MNALLEHVWGRSRAQDLVWKHVTGLAPTRAVRRLIMVLNFQAFMDESVGVPPHGDFVLAGYIAPAQVWAAFSKDWEEALPLGLKGKDGKYYFKMSEMALVPERMARVKRFSEIIDLHPLIPISCRLNLGEFENALSRFHAFAARMGWNVDMQSWANPYFFSFRLLLDLFHQQKHMLEHVIPLDEKVDFIFDDRTEKKYIRKVWDDSVEGKEPEMRERFGAEPRFEKDADDFVALQAADFWAWWVREWYEEDNYDPPEKMANFDFGLWRGKKRPFLTVYATEDKLLEVFQSLCMRNIIDGNVDPISASMIRGEI
jgi:hypothetical protein